MRRLLIVLVFLLALGALADWFLKQEAEVRVAKQVGDAFELKSDPNVSIEGFPFVWSALRGRFSAIVVTADSLRKEGIALHDFEARLEDLRFELSAVMSGKANVAARRGSGTVIVALGTINRLVSEEAPVDFELFRDGGSLAARSEGRSFSTDLEINNNALVVSPEGLPSVTLQLPQIGRGVIFKQVDATSDGLRLSFVLSDAALLLAD